MPLVEPPQKILVCTALDVLLLRFRLANLRRRHALFAKPFQKTESHRVQTVSRRWCLHSHWFTSLQFGNKRSECNSVMMVVGMHPQSARRQLPIWWWYFSRHPPSSSPSLCKHRWPAFLSLRSLPLSRVCVHEPPPSLPLPFKGGGRYVGRIHSAALSRPPPSAALFYGFPPLPLLFHPLIQCPPPSPPPPPTVGRTVRHRTSKLARLPQSVHACMVLLRPLLNSPSHASSRLGCSRSERMGGGWNGGIGGKVGLRLRRRSFARSPLSPMQR